MCSPPNQTDQKNRPTEQSGEGSTSFITGLSLNEPAKPSNPQAAHDLSQHPNGTPAQKSAPAAPQPALWANIPQELTELTQWCLAERPCATDDKKAAAKRKRPLTANGQAASVSDPATWCDFETAARAAQAKGMYIGFVLTTKDPYAVGDLDVKAHTSDSVLQQHANFIERANSYTEFSRSGVGSHVWLRGKIGKGIKGEFAELYSQDRFIICTGNIDTRQPKTINEGQHFLDGIIEQAKANSNQLDPLPDEPERESDEVILQRARDASNADKFIAHYDGGMEAIDHNDHSKADHALLQMLAFYTTNNEQLKRLFLASKLGQRNKARKRKDYLPRTIASVRANQAMDHARSKYHIEHGKRIAAVLLEAFDRHQEKQQVHEKAQAKSRFEIFSTDELMKQPSVRWRIKGILPQEGFAVLYGPPSCGKSFLTLDMLAHISAGIPWFGYKVKQSSVAYVAFEGTHGVPQRIKAFAREKWKPDQIVFLWPNSISLIKPADRDALIEVLQDQLVENGVICIDTLAASAPGIDENTSEGMGKLISELQTVQRKVGGCVLVIHHTGKDSERGLRGWSGLNGAIETRIEVTKTNSGARSWIAGKQKDGQDGFGESFTLQQVLIDHDEDGDPITSCVVALAAQYNADDHSVRVAEENDFVWEWVRKEVEVGNFPSRRSLEGQRDQKKALMPLTQKQLRDTIARLVSEGRLQEEKGNGKQWLSAVERVRVR